MNEICFRNVTKMFGKKEILTNENFSLKDGITFLVGKNGAGKTTFIKLATGLEAVNGGKVMLFEQPVQKLGNAEKLKLGLQLQNEAFLRSVKVKEYIGLYSSLYDKGNGSAINLENDIKEILCIDELLNQYAYTLSGGEKKRLSLFLAIIGHKELVILDEPTAGIDVEVKDKIITTIQYLKKQKMNIIVSSHDLDEFYNITDSLLILNKGIIFDGSKEEFEKKYNYKFKVCTDKKIEDTDLVIGNLFERHYLYSTNEEKLTKHFPKEAIEKTNIKDLYQIALLQSERKDI